MKKWLLLITLTWLLTGCADTDTIKSKTTMFGKVQNIEITDLRSKRINGIMLAQATITNTSSSTIQEVYYRCRFYDINKFEVGANIAWVPVMIYGGQSQVVTCNADSADAIDFKLELSSTGSAVEVYK